MRLLLHNDKDKSKSRWWVLSQRKIEIGRDSACDIVLNDPKVSRIHAEINFEDGEYLLIDKNSTNGTIINGSQAVRQALLPGDVIIIGNYRITVMEDSDPSKVEWRDDQPIITARIPVDYVGKRISEVTAHLGMAIPAPSARKQKKPQVPSEALPPEKITKLLNHLETIYNMTREFTSIMVTGDLFAVIEKNLFATFPDIERFCIITKSEDGKKYSAKYVSARIPGEEKGFEISRNVFQNTLENKISVLTSDAASDNRFIEAESVIGLNLRSIMCAPLVSKGGVIGVLYSDNRTKPGCFDNEDLELFTAIANQIAAALENASLYEEIQRSYHEVILCLINAIEAKDPYTMGHTQRTSHYALGIAQELKLGEEVCRRLITAAELHDIGKIGIKERLISKETKLSETEYHSVQEHVLMGEKILRPITYLHYILPIIRGHHEHFDGSGYPDGLKGEAILLESRILAVADSFDAMTSQRPYNTPLSFAQALNECKKGAGVQFDPVVVDALERFMAANYELTDYNISAKGKKKGETSKTGKSE